MMLHRFGRLFAAAVFALLAAAPAAAQDYPNRVIKMVIAFPPGGPTDFVGRLLADKLKDLLGQSVIIENKPGAAGAIGAESVVRSAPDGYTLFLTTSGAVVITPHLQADAHYDPVRDFTPITHVVNVTTTLVVRPELGVNSAKDLVAMAKAKPATIPFASTGIGSPPHIALELLQSAAGVKLVHVPYPGSAQALTDLIAGRIGLMFGAASTTLPYVKDGKLVALAMAQSKRAALAPEVPSMTDAGLPGFDTSVWFGLLAPAGTPPDVVAALSREVNAALKTDAVIGPLRAQGMEPIGGTPAEFATYIAGETAKWAPVVEAAGLKK